MAFFPSPLLSARDNPHCSHKFSPHRGMGRKEFIRLNSSAELTKYVDRTIALRRTVNFNTLTVRSRIVFETLLKQFPLLPRCHFSVSLKGTLTVKSDFASRSPLIQRLTSWILNCLGVESGILSLVGAHGRRSSNSVHPVEICWGIRERKRSTCRCVEPHESSGRHWPPGRLYPSRLGQGISGRRATSARDGNFERLGTDRFPRCSVYFSRPPRCLIWAAPHRKGWKLRSERTRNNPEERASVRELGLQSPFERSETNQWWHYGSIDSPFYKCPFTMSLTKGQPTGREKH